MATPTPRNEKPLDAYAKWTATTAMYPGAGTGSPAALAYLIVGLAAELAERELADLVDERQQELGDVMYYCARIAVENGVSLHRMWVEHGEFGDSRNPLRDHRHAEAQALGAVQKMMRGHGGVDVAYLSYEYAAATLCRLWLNDRERIVDATEKNRAKLTARLEKGQIIRAPGQA